MIRKTAFTSRGESRPATAAMKRPVRTNPKAGFVEFHPSMSLENPTTVLDLLPPTAPTPAISSSEPQAVENDAELTLEGVLAHRGHVWTKVSEIIEKLNSVEAYCGDVLALQKLQQLRLLCKQRETHLRTLQLTLLKEGRVLPHKDSTAATTLETTETNDKENPVVDQSTTDPEMWKQDENGRVEIVDSDAIDLIELSERSF